MLIDGQEWKLVPVEPTEEMIDAAYSGQHGAGPASDYAAMLAAAPTPPLQAAPSVQVAFPANWGFNVTHSDDRVWLTIITPHGASATLSAAEKTASGGLTIAAQVLDYFRDSFGVQPFAATPCDHIAAQAQSWAPAGPLWIECDPERFGEAPWHVTDGRHHAVGGTPNEALNRFARHLATEATALRAALSLLESAASGAWRVAERRTGEWDTLGGAIGFARGVLKATPLGDRG